MSYTGSMGKRCRIPEQLVNTLWNTSNDSIGMETNVIQLENACWNIESSRICCFPSCYDRKLLSSLQSGRLVSKNLHDLVVITIQQTLTQNKNGSSLYSKLDTNKVADGSDLD